MAKSKKLLAEAGFPNGLEIVLNGPQGRYVRDKEVAEAVAGQLTKAGIKTTLRTYEFVNYLNNMVYVHKAGPGVADRLGASARWTPRRSTCRSSSPPSIFVNWHNEDFNGMVERGAVADGREEAPRPVPADQQARGSRRSPAMPLYQQIDLYGANKRLTWKARSDELIHAYDMSLKDGK